mgnify:CR=1 FL=1
MSSEPSSLEPSQTAQLHQVSGRPVVRGGGGVGIYWPLVPAVLLLSIWQWHSIASRGAFSLIPSLQDTVLAFFRLLIAPEMWRAAWESFLTLAIGFSFSLVIGILLGTLLALRPKLGSYFELPITILLVSPLVALIPLVVMVFGIGLAASAAVVFLFSVSYIVINTVVGIHAVPASLKEMAQSFNATGWQVFFKILLPSALPEILAGIRNGGGHAITGMVAAQLTLITMGFGRLVEDYSSHLQNDLLFATILIVVILGAAALSVLEKIERRFAPWK